MNVGCVRNADLRRTASGSASPTLAKSGSSALLRAVVAERAPDRLDVVARRRLVERQAERVRIDPTEIHSLRDAALGDSRGGITGRDDDGVEEMRRRHGVAQSLEPRLEDRRQAMHAPRDHRQPRGAMVDRVHRRHHREQDLRRADVRRRLLAADVLLARLQCEAVRRPAVGVDGDPDQAAGHRTLEVVARCEIGRMRPAAAHRHAETLRRSDDHVGAPLARWREKRQREEIGGDDDVPAGRVHRRRERAKVAHVAVRAGILEQDRKRPRIGRVGRGSGHDVDPERRRARAHDVDRLGEDVGGYEEPVASAVAEAVAQRHRLGRSSRFVEHRRVGDRHPRHVADHRLEIDECLEPSLRNLGLVRRIGGVPRWIFQHVAQDHAGGVRAVVPLADERLQYPVLRRDRPDARERGRLGQRRRQRERRLRPDRRGNDRVHQRGARTITQDLEHRGLVIGRRADVPRDERRRRFEHGHHASPIVAS